MFGEDALNTIKDARERLLVDNPRIIPNGVRIFATPVQSEALRNRFTVEQSAGFDVRSFNLLADRRVLQVDLNTIDYTPLAESTMVLEVAFDETLELLGEQETSLEVNAGGQFDGYVIWYELLLGGNEVLSTAPTEGKTHWIQGFLPEWGETKFLSPGQRLTVACVYRRYLLWLETQIGPVVDREG